MKLYLKANLFVATTVLLCCALSKSAELTEPNCGITSSISLANLFSSERIDSKKLQAEYPTETVTLLDVKRMCSEIGISTSGFKANFDELIALNTPCIISLKNPEHFLVLLDGNKNSVRVLNGESGDLEVMDRNGVESRYTGLALVPDLRETVDSPRLFMPYYDQNLVFAGMGQKVLFRFPIENKGTTPLEIEIMGTSCGCTTALIEHTAGSKTVIAPNSSKEIAVSFEVNTQAPTQQTVALKTNDFRRPKIYLSVRGQLPTQLTLSPPALYVNQNVGSEHSKSFKIIGPQGTKIEKVWSDLEFLNFKISPQIANGNKTESGITIAGLKNAAPGLINGKVWVRMQDGKEIFVALRGEIHEVGNIENPQPLNLPKAEDDPNNHIALAIPNIEIGQSAPGFSVTDSKGKHWSLSDFKGKKNLLLTFFPKCFTGGCANHLSSLRDQQNSFDRLDTQILAVSVDLADGKKGQNAFATQWHFGFPMIPDINRSLSKLYGAVQNQNQLAARMSVLIDKKGIVRFIDTSVDVNTHGADMISKIRELDLG